MKLCYICSRYADPDPALRRRNIAEARALARWAEAQGYACVTWWGSLEPDDPPCDSDPEVRRAALARSAELAAMVGKMGGDILIAGWYPVTSGMSADVDAYWNAIGMTRGGTIPWPEVEPYYRAPVDTVPRAAVQAVADEMNEGIERIENNICNGASAELGTMAIRAYQDALDELRDKCGVTPSEVQS